MVRSSSLTADRGGGATAEPFGGRRGRRRIKRRPVSAQKKKSPAGKREASRGGDPASLPQTAFDNPVGIVSRRSASRRFWLPSKAASRSGGGFPSIVSYPSPHFFPLRSSSTSIPEAPPR